MTQKSKTTEPRGGSVSVGDEVKHSGGTLNPGDPGYQEAARKAPLNDPDRKGAFNRAASFRDLDESTQAAKAQQQKAAAKPAVEPNTGGKR